LDKVENALSIALTTAVTFLVGAVMMESVWRRGMSVMVDHTVQMDQMNPPPLVVHLPAPVIQTFVFKMERRFYLDKTVETALIFGRILVGAATVECVWRSGGSATLIQTVQMEKMNPPPLVVHLPVPVIQTFVFQLGRRLNLDKTVENAVMVIGAATVDSVW